MTDGRRTDCGACGTSYADAALRNLPSEGWLRDGSVLVERRRCLCERGVLLSPHPNLGADVVLVLGRDGVTARPVRFVSLTERNFVSSDGHAYRRRCAHWAPSMRPSDDPVLKTELRDFVPEDELPLLLAWAASLAPAQAESAPS